MPNKKVCAACVHRGCDCAAIVLKIRTNVPDFSQSEAERLPGTYCRPVAWQVVFAELRGPRAAELIGGEVRSC